MKQLIYFVVGILVLSGFSVLGMGDASEKQETLNIIVSRADVLEKDGFVEIHIDGATTQLAEPNRPVLPVYVKDLSDSIPIHGHSGASVPRMNIGTMRSATGGHSCSYRPVIRDE